MTDKQDRTAIKDFIVARKELVWYVRDVRNLDDAAIVEAVLNYGDWDDVQELFAVMGITRAADVFRAHAFGKRTNYHKKTRAYFDLYFARYA